MTSMNCGCQIISDTIRFDKKVFNENGLIINIINLSHRYQQYVSVCGNCVRKARLFNDIEKSKLDLAKEQFKILTEENVVEEPEPEINPEN